MSISYIIYGLCCVLIGFIAGKAVSAGKINEIRKRALEVLGLATTMLGTIELLNDEITKLKGELDNGND